MAKTSMKMKQQAKPKFSTRAYTRCRICGRPHSVLKKYGICRICFRELAYKGQIGLQGPDPGREESQLVISFNLVNPQSGGKINDNERSYCRYAYKNP